MVTLTQVVVKHLFGVNSHQYSLPAHDGNFWDSGLPSDQLKMTVCSTAVLHLLSVDPAHAAESNRNYWACAQWGSP
ncbi:hypothetical protein, partial [Pseudomonas amygdali]